MKKVKFFAAIWICQLFFTACSQDYDPVYSCDKQIDAWVKSNVDEVHAMTRAQWKGLSNKVNVAVYRAFTPEQKIKFWQEKFAEVKSLNWDTEEFHHIQKAEDFFMAHHDVYYEGRRTDEELDEIDKFFYTWQKEAERNFGWTKEIAYSIAGTGLALKDRKGTLEIRKKSLRSSAKMAVASESGNDKSECNCNTESNISCFPTVSYPCEDADCIGTTMGCGWLWVSECDGRCGGL